MNRTCSKVLLITITCGMSLIAHGVELGKTPPPLGSTKSYNTPQGAEVTLSQFRGKVVFVNFWATWCGSCVRSIPYLTKLHKEYADKGLVIIAHTNGSSSGIKEFIKKYQIPFIISVGDSIGKGWNVSTLPQGVLIDTQGKVIWSGHADGVTEQIIESALKSVTAAQRSSVNPHSPK